jgi:hypothetical protein
MSIIGKIGREIGEEVAEGLSKKAAPKVMPAVKKPLEWGFKGRKPTDIEDLSYIDLEENLINKRPDFFSDKFKNKKEKKEHDQLQDILDLNWDILSKGAKKNKFIKELIDNQLSYGDSLSMANNKFNYLQNLGVPRELTGKIIGSQFQPFRGNFSIDNFKKGWLRYYNELTKSQKETFDILSDEWNGTMDELIDAVKLL